MVLSVIHGDCLQELPRLATDGVRFHACVCDPPYHLGAPQGRSSRAPEGMYSTMRAGFMGKQWDGGDIAFRPETWRAVYDVLLPGAYLVAFASTRGYHRMVCAIEDAGFVIHPMLAWIFGTGFPKASDASKAIDKAAGAVRAEVVGYQRATGNARGKGAAGHYANGLTGVNGYEVVKDGWNITAPATPEAAAWEGWKYGLQSLKPAIEPICLAQRPMIGTGAQNLLAHGCGALNIGASRIPAASGDEPLGWDTPRGGIWSTDSDATGKLVAKSARYPANVIHDGSDEVLAAFAAYGERSSGVAVQRNGGGQSIWGDKNRIGSRPDAGFGDAGSPARFFYSSKASASDRADSRHPTIKPIDLMRYLVRLVTPPAGHVLDPFAGSGSTGEACMLLGMDCTMIEREATHAADIRHRVARWSGADTPLFADVAD